METVLYSYEFQQYFQFFTASHSAFISSASFYYIELRQVAGAPTVRYLCYENSNQ